VEVVGGIVTAEICRDHCPHVNHDPAPGAQRPVEPPVTVAYQPSLVSIAMVTAPRPVSTLQRSISELRQAGFPQTVHLFAEPGSTAVAGNDVVTHANDKPLGAWHNWQQAAEAMLVACDSPFILVCEDDIRLARCAACGLQFAIERFPHRDWGFASLYTPRYNLTDHGRQSGWLSVRSASLWGALAWCFTRESLRAVLDSDVVAEHRGDRDTDLVVSQAIRQLNRRVYFHVPSLGKHAGAGISSLGHAPKAASAAIQFDASYQQYVKQADTTRSPAVDAPPRLTQLSSRRDTASSGKLTTSAAPIATRDDSITVVIPNYNCGDYLPACLDSLLRQTIGCQIVVVDDASTDHSLEVLRGYEPAVRVVRHERNRGANPARLTGIQHSQSTWVLAADADAVYAPRFLEALVGRSERTTAVAYCGMRRKILPSGREQVVGVGEFDAAALWWDNYISMCSLVRRAALPLDLMAHTDFLEDWRLWLHMACRGDRFVAVNEVLFDAVVRPQGKSAHIESHAHRLAVEIANLRRPYARLIGCDDPISVVIPATDSADLTCECLWHLARYTGLPLQVVYVDNGSRRGTIEQVEQAAELLQLPLDVIANRANRGFTEAVNQGMEASIGRHLLCLNNDCFVGPQCIERMFRQLTGSGERIAAVGPLSGDDSRHSLRQPWLRDEAGIDRDHQFDYHDAVAGFQVVNKRHKRTAWRQDHLLAFFCTLLHRDALAACGRLDERTREFRSGLGADDDWCHRVSAANWQLRIALDAYAVHLGNRTFDRLGIDRRGLQQQALRRLKSFDYAGQ
jgi:GT2 family glycosyltransferase